MCDWLSWRHDYAAENEAPALFSGHVFKVDPDGAIQWDAPSWADVRCPSSDTAVRVKCDGRRLYFSGNAGRFGHRDNLTGIGVQEAFLRSLDIVRRVFPQVDLTGVGLRERCGTVAEFGTRLTRLDLCANFDTDSYAALATVLASRRVGQKAAQLGKYGPTWGYDAKRAQYWKAKLYDKTAEATGRRTPSAGATLARFEIQLGSEYLRQKRLDVRDAWSDDMAKVIYGKFAEQVFRDAVGVEDWTSIPVKLRAHAIMWRDGVSPRSYLSQSGYYKVRAQLLAFGVDIGVPCNVIALTQRVRTVEVRPVNNIRAAA